MLWEGIALEALSGERRAQAPSPGEGILISCCIFCGGGGGRGGPSPIGQVLKERISSREGRSLVSS